MEGTREKVYEIKIETEGGMIRLHQNHAVAVFTNSVIKWTCDKYPFAVQFKPGSPLQAKRGENNSFVLDMGEKATLYCTYKYTIAVYDTDNKMVLILDPVLVPIPPKG